MKMKIGNPAYINPAPKTARKTDPDFTSSPLQQVHRKFMWLSNFVIRKIDYSAVPHGTPEDVGSKYCGSISSRSANLIRQINQDTERLKYQLRIDCAQSKLDYCTYALEGLERAEATLWNTEEDIAKETKKLKAAKIKYTLELKALNNPSSSVD